MNWSSEATLRAKQNWKTRFSRRRFEEEVPEECSRSGIYAAFDTRNRILNVVPLLTSLSTLIRPRCS